MTLKLNSPIVIFDEKAHTYDVQGKLFTGVTTILGVKNKDFLKWWTVKEMYNFLLNRHDEAKKMSFEEWEQLLQEGKRAHTKKTKNAADIGTKVHAWIEEYIKTGKKVKPKDEKVRACVEQFLLWERSHKIEWLGSEVIVVSMAHQYAGTVDAIAKIDGKVSVVDFKTSSQMSEEHNLQTAAYQNALEEMGLKADQRVIVRIPKDGTPVEEKIVETPYEFDRDTFLHLREVHRWNVFIENNKKQI